MKNLTKKAIIFVLCLMVIMVAAMPVFAAGNNTGVVNMNPKDVKGTTSNLSNETDSIARDILGVVQTVAVVIAVIMLVVLAIKYLTAAPSEKADIKKSAITYVIGAILLFGAAGILGIVQNWAIQIGNSGN